MRVGIVMPVLLQEPTLLDCTRVAVEHLVTKHDARLYVICNRLHVCTADELLHDLQGRFAGNVTVVNEPGVERSVAASWNLGARLAISSGAEYITFVANDTRLRSNCLDTLVDFGKRGGADLWSGVTYNGTHIDVSTVTDGADFTCFVTRPTTFEKHGWFDPNFRPAYFEDNDYYARIVLGRGECCAVHAAQFHHHRSATIRLDDNAARHVSHWFEVNRSYFARKWAFRNQPTLASPFYSELTTRVGWNYGRVRWRGLHRPFPLLPNGSMPIILRTASKATGNKRYQWASFGGLFRDTAAFLASMFPDARTYFDAGCAKGFLIRALRETSAEAWGCDFSSWATSHAEMGACLTSNVCQLNVSIGSATMTS